MMAVPLHILMLEDRPEDAELAVHQLRREGFAPQWQRVDTLADFLAALESPPELVLSDFSIPQLDVMEALRLFRKKGLEIPFILISGTIGEERAVAAMKAGATDYVPKDRLECLGRVVIRALEECRLRCESRVAAEQLSLQAATLNAAANAIMITDRSGTIVWINPAFTTMTGYTREEALGQNPRLLRSEKHGPEFYRDVWETILAGKVWRGEFINRRKDGSHYFDMQSITPVRDEWGEITHFIAIHQDVTEHKKLQEQFLQAQKMEVVGQLAGGIAHDFNNLLTVICGFGEMLRESLPPKGPAHDFVTQIIKAGQRAVGLTQQLLAFSRKQVLQPQVLDLNAEIAEAQKMLGRLLGEDIDLEVLAGPDLHRVKADPGQIQQVLMNLAVNARDAMTRSGKLRIATSNVIVDTAVVLDDPRAHPGAYVLLEVSDSGCGMPPEVLARIFEPFFTTKGPGTGTGLGLATVLGIVEQSGGCIDVESRPGSGSIFRIYLPRADATPSVTKPRPSAVGRRRGNECILLVEDDAGVRALTAMILDRAGYTVLQACDGESGIALFDKHPGRIQLLLTDVVMPHMSGCELAKLLESRQPTLRVLHMSGYLDDALVRHGIQERGLAFIHKPFQAEALLTKTREVLDAPAAAAG